MMSFGVLTCTSTIQFMHPIKNHICRLTQSLRISLMTCWLSGFAPTVIAVGFEAPAPPEIAFEQYQTEAGVIDYIAALNDVIGSDLAPEENVAPSILMEIDPPGRYSPAFISQWWQAVGLEEPKQPGQWISWPDFLAAQAIEGEEAIDERTPYLEADPSATPVWSAIDYPDMARWLEQVGPAMDRISIALEGDEAWLPMIGEPGQPVYAVRLPHLLIARHLARTFQYRIGLALQEARVDDAIQDFGSIRRLGLLMDREPLALGQLVRISIYRLSHGCLEAICSGRSLNLDQLSTLAEIVDQTAFVRGGMRQAYATGERAVVLSSFDFLLRSDDWDAHFFADDLLSQQAAEEMLPRLHRAFNHPGFDIDLARETINNNINDFWEITSSQEFERFQNGSDLYWRAFNLAKHQSTRMIVAGSENALKPMDAAQRRSYTLSVTYGYLNIVLPTFAEARTEWYCLGYERAARLLVAALRYEIEHGELPDQAGQVQGLKTEDPLWPGQRLLLLESDSAFKIYSRSINGKDDQARDDHREGDLVISIQR